jgi:hypothetical protein
MPRVCDQFTSKKGLVYTLTGNIGSNYRILINKSVYSVHALKNLAEQEFMELKEKYGNDS